MKRILRMILVIAGFWLILTDQGCSRFASRKVSAPTEKFVVATYNIRIDAKIDKKTDNHWANRKDHVAKIIRDYNFDIFGTQEGYAWQLEELLELLPGYSAVTRLYGGDEGKSGNVAIIFKNSEFEVAEDGVFWYSETPDRESIGWDADDTRLCTWARMRHLSSGKEFYFFNSHFYWRYIEARKNSGKVFLAKMLEIVKDDLPVICTGDLNSEVTSPQIRDILTVLKDSRQISETPPQGPENTDLGGGHFEGDPIGRIDYILINDKIRVLSYKTIGDQYEKGRYPSDHLPVVCDLIF